MIRIRELRNKLGLSGEALGELVGVKKSAISKYERGEIQPSNEVLLRIANQLNTSTDYLLENIDDPTPPSKKKPTPETVGPALVEILKKHGYLKDDKPLSDEEADYLLRVMNAIWEAQKPSSQENP